ncbi:MAG: tRNA (adenosine(37)-N6)-threonylcarbamoyltransferase complex ATPase subunit type 1 TsaE [Clostridia bacterium]|nr:tRNA (adenosine(37)-N6)-threonylcarbamoyltransferase complex ATPase subunit type 1 TsaE [Clostridia bacterium]
MGKKILSSAATEETECIGRELAEELLHSGRKNAFIALYGDLGVGKTAFTRGFVSAICPAARVKSPTYTVVNEYRGGAVPVFHFDMYRIDGEDDLYSTGFYDYLEGGYLLSEWSENIPFALPGDRIAVTIEKSGVDSRRITIEEIE